MLKKILYPMTIVLAVVGLSACSSMGANNSGKQLGATIAGSDHPLRSYLGAYIGSHS